MIDGDENKKIVQCRNIKPEKIEIKHVIGERYSTDDSVYEELICGKCGKIGQMVKVPKEIVHIEEAILEIQGV